MKNQNYNRAFTPDKINELKNNEIFVFAVICKEHTEAVQLA